MLRSVVPRALVSSAYECTIVHWSTRTVEQNEKKIDRSLAIVETRGRSISANDDVVVKSRQMNSNLASRNAAASRERRRTKCSLEN